MCSMHPKQKTEKIEISVDKTVTIGFTGKTRTNQSQLDWSETEVCFLILARKMTHTKENLESCNRLMYNNRNYHQSCCALNSVTFANCS